METNTRTMSAAALVDIPSGVRGALGSARNGVRIYGALAGLALVAVIAVAGTGHSVNTFMWVRAVLLPVIAVVIHRMAVSASRGSRRAFERLSSLAVIMPIAIVGVDLIPGVCPPWYMAMQVVCMLPVVGVAIITRRAVVRAAFAKKG